MKKTGILVILFLAVLIFFILSMKRPGEKGADWERGEMTGQSALSMLQEVGGESRIDQLADLKLVTKEEDPAQYLVRNSVFLMDEEAVEAYVGTCLTGAESTARAENMTCEDLVMKEWGYESMDAYLQDVKEQVTDFLKCRLVVYEAARIKGIQITGKDYEKLLPSYAERFGFEDEQEFAFSCTPASIACEMLFDRTCSWLEGER